ncbi:hypothetical protein KKI95_19475 [Xenorhabdus bovienii]|nr:hypothetical protein [Xenorhabdus bovienii]
MGQTGDDGINTGHNNVTVAAGEIIGLQSNYGCSTKLRIAGSFVRSHSWSKDLITELAFSSLLFIPSSG